MSLVYIVLLRYFGSNSVFFFSTVSFSNEDNHCQLYATLDFVKFIVSIYGNRGKSVCSWPNYTGIGIYICNKLLLKLPLIEMLFLLI